MSPGHVMAAATGPTRSNRLHRALRAACVMWCCACLAGCEPGTPAPQPPVDLQGVTHNPLTEVRDAALVLLFVRTDCPVSNRYVPRVLALQGDFAPAQVEFVLVYPDPNESPADIAAHHAEYGIDTAAFRTLRDIEHQLVQTTGATMTPEAAVYVATDTGPRLVYRGRIDDQFVDYGKTRAEPTARDLREVLMAVTAGDTVVEPRTTQAVGCPIPRLRSSERVQ